MKRLVVVHYSIYGSREYKIMNVPSNLSRKTLDEYLTLKIANSRQQILHDRSIKILKVRQFKKRPRKRK